MTAANQNTYEPRSKHQPTRAFLNALAQRRNEIYQHATNLERSDALAAFVFDLLIRLAQHNHSFIDRSLIQRLSDQLERFEEPISEVNIPLMEGMVLTLEQALTLGAPPPSTHEIINALFARGYNIYLSSKTSDERREFASKVIKQLPAIERLGPFKLSDFIDYACTSDEALRFWQLYVERVAAEVDRRTAQSEREAHTWTLSSLLNIHEIGPNALIGKRWEMLRRHVERIMQSRQEDRRWRYLRLLIESCKDHRALYFILSSPAVIEDQSIPFIFLTRGNRKLQSCALFLLHTTKVHRKQLHNILEYFEDRTLAEVGERVVELYAQTQLFTHPSAVINVISEGLTSIIAHKVKDEPVEPLLNAITNDAHAFRQSLFLTEVIPQDRQRNSPVHVQLLERVLQSFFHTFTPSGVRHPLNDSVFQTGITQAIVELMRDHDSGHTAHLKSFGLTLNKAAQRWIRGESEEELSKRSLLLSYFIGLYVHVIRRAALNLYRKYETQARALELYELMINLYLSEPHACAESGAYEAILPLLQALFPEFTSADYIESPSQSRLEEAADLIAQVESERAQVDDLRGLLSEWQDRNRGREILESSHESDDSQEKAQQDDLLEVETRGHVPVITTSPVRAQVRLYEMGKQNPMSVLQTYLGIDTMRFYAQRVLKWLGITPQGELSLVGEQVFLSQRYQGRGGNSVASRDLRFHVSQMSGVSVELPLRSFYYVFGVLALIVFCFLGGHFLFAGVRGSEAELGLIGLILITIGFSVDGAMNALREQGSKEVILRVERHNSARPIVLGVNREEPEGQALLNAFMAESIKQREELFMRNLTEAAQRERERIERESEILPESNEPLAEDQSADSSSDGLTALGTLGESNGSTSEISTQNEPNESADHSVDDPSDYSADDSADDIDQEAVREDELDISFEDESDIEDDEEDQLSQRELAEPMTIVPPLPGESTLDSMVQADLAELDQMMVDSLDASSEGLEGENSLKSDEIPPRSEELSQAFDFVTSMGAVTPKRESDS